MCVAVKHGLLFVSDPDSKQLHAYSLVDGSLTRTFGEKRTERHQSHFTANGLCLSPDGNCVLVADFFNDCVQEVRIVDGAWVRSVGKSTIQKPQYVDCNADVIVVSEWYRERISVLSWADGRLRLCIGNYGHGPGQAHRSCMWFGVRLLANGSEVAIADYNNDRICVYTLLGEFIAAVGGAGHGWDHPHDVLERVSDGSFVVAHSFMNSVVHVRRDGGHVGEFGTYGEGDGQLWRPVTVAALPSDGYLVLEVGNRRVQQFQSLHARVAWMHACARTNTNSCRRVRPKCM